ncbi:MAG TPA: tetratricopeptide repeat protein [Magnetospirillaceae bacterium]|jgi:tetratricopeptide (TPR) repeat protein
MDARQDSLTDSLKEINRRVADGDLKGAMDHCSLLLRDDPQCAPALHMMGLVAARMGDQGLALSFVERAHQIEPDWREYPAMLAYLSASIGRITDALYYAKLATVLAPHPESELLIPANLPMGRDVFDNVELSTHWLLAEAAFHAGRYAEAIQEAESELRINPQQYNSLVLLARSHQALGHHDIARGHLLAATGLQPNTAAAVRWLGDVLLSLGEHDQALVNHRTSLALESDSDSIIAAHALFQLPWQTSANYSASREAATEWRDRAAPPRRRATFHEVNPIIGILWDQCHSGPLVDFFLPVLDHFKTAIVYRLNRRTDATTELVRSKAMRFQDCADLDAATLDRIIAGDAPGMLINLCNSAEEARFPQFGGDFVPPIVQWLGVPAPDRLPGADMVIGSAATAAVDRILFDADKVIALPQLLTWRFPATGVEAETVKPLPRDLSGQVTFGAIGDMRRITAETVALWASVLRAVPDASILIGNASGAWPQPIAERLGQMFANFGVVNRVRLQGPHEPTTVNLDLFGRIDVLLDTTPVTGMNDVAEALWMGVPVVTLRGDRRAGCIGAAILDAAGRGDWVAATGEDYVAIAARLAAAADLDAIRAGLRDSVSASALCDAKGFVDAFGAALMSRLLVPS